MAKSKSKTSKKTPTASTGPQTNQDMVDSTQEQEKPLETNSDVLIDIYCKYDKLVDPKKLKPHPANPARHPENQVALLAKIISSHGVRHPIIVSKKSGFIVSGHCRCQSAMLLGMKEFPVVYQDYKDQSEELAVLVADNQIQELAEIDGSKLGDIIVELDQVDYPLELTALSPAEIEDYVVGPTTIAMPDLPNGEKYPFQQMTFTLHDSQVEIVQNAVKKAKENGDFSSSENENSNGNALALIAGEYLGKS